MTIRKRVKNKWHFTVGDFHFSKATYQPNGNRTFDVYYKGSFVGECNSRRHCMVKRNEIFKLDILDRTLSFDKIVGELYCVGKKNGFPIKINSAILFPKKLSMVSERTVLMEKYNNKIYLSQFKSPGVFTREND